MSYPKHGLRRFPVMTHKYESANVPGLFFAGILGHGRDVGRAAGALIHGYRYTCKTLVRMLMAEGAAHEGAAAAEKSTNEPARLATDQGWEAKLSYHAIDGWDLQNVGEGVGKGWRHEDQKVVYAVDGMPGLIDHLFGRINTASAPMLMVSEIGDGIVLRCEHDLQGDSAPSEGANHTVLAEYYEEMPAAHFHAKFAGRDRIFWVFGFNGQRRSLDESVFGGTQFEVLM